DLSSEIEGKVVLITGVSPGSLGAFFVSTVAKHSPKLIILASRDFSKLQAVVAAITADPASPQVATRLLKLDLASQAQIRQAAKEVLAYAENIDVLVNSAGVMATPYGTTADGLEMQFGANHIGHFLFTNLIMPKLLTSPAPRVVSVTSDGHRLSPIRWDDYGFQGGKTYEKWRAYGQSKTANMLFAVSLAEKLGEKRLRAYSVHPGVIFTNLGQLLAEEDFKNLRDLDKELGNKEGEREGLVIKQIDEGTATHVVGAFDPRIADYNGAYLLDGHLAPDDEIKPYAVDPKEAEGLWKLSESLLEEDLAY
ncbi:WW domain-containing oxidoreductase, partial [Cenococcum geophilum]